MTEETVLCLGFKCICEASFWRWLVFHGSEHGFFKLKIRTNLMPLYKPSVTLPLSLPPTLDWDLTPAWPPASITGQEGPAQESLLIPHPPGPLCSPCLAPGSPLHHRSTALTQMHPHAPVPPCTRSPYAVTQQGCAPPWSGGQQNWEQKHELLQFFRSVQKWTRHSNLKGENNNHKEWVATLS